MNDPDRDLKILRVNMADRTTREEGVSGTWKVLGGRAFTSHWVSLNVEPSSDPLGRKNSLVIAPGLLAGTPASNGQTWITT